MNLGESLKNIFSRKKSLDKVSVDELRKEKIALEQQEVKFTRQIEQIEDKKKELFRKGAGLSSEREQRMLARKIKDYDSQAKAIDSNCAFINRQLRILNGFLQLKENETLLKNYGLSNVINNMDMANLQVYIEKATVGRQFNIDRFQEILGRLEEGEGLVEDTGEERDIDDIVGLMQGLSGDALDTDVSESALAEGLQRVDETLNRKESDETEF